MSHVRNCLWLESWELQPWCGDGIAINRLSTLALRWPQLGARNPGTALTDMFDDYSIRWRVREPDGHIVGYTTHIATAQASVQTGAVCRERTAQGMMHSHRVSVLLDFHSGEVELGREDGERKGNLRLILGARSRHAMGYTSCR
jgi:hypothetical protein